VLKPVSSAISIGTGGPFGAEGPIIMTGGALGSIVAQYLHLTADERKVLLVSGAAGGMAATFNSNCVLNRRMSRWVARLTPATPCGTPPMSSPSRTVFRCK
jgi:hypothetical protein